MPPEQQLYISRDERVDDWRIDGVKDCPRVLRAPSGCYIVEAKYREEYLRAHGPSPLWGLSLALGALDTASRLHHSTYETGYVPFALQLRPGHRYYVTATFDGDQFIPRIVELNANAERTREILPASSAEELKTCQAQGAKGPNLADTVCVANARAR